MTREEEIAFTPAYELREMIGRKEISPVELTEISLRRIEAMNPKLNAFLTVTADEAMADARAAEAGGGARGRPRPTSRHTHLHQGPRTHEGRPNHERLAGLQGLGTRL